MSVTTKHVHVALRVDDGNVTVAGRGLCTSDQTEFVFVVLSSIVVVAAKLLSLFHLLVIQVEALVGILDDERVHHGY